MHRVTLIWVLAYVLVGILFILLGVLREAPGAFRVATVYVAWPIAYLILLTGASTFRRLIVLNSMIVIGAIAIGLYALSHVLTSLGVLPSWLYIPLDQGQYVVQGSGWIAIRLLSSTTLFFALPYTIASLMLVQLAGHSIIKTRWLWLSLLLGLMMVVLRRSNGFILITAAAPFFAITLFAIARFEAARGVAHKVFRLAFGTVLVGLVLVLTTALALWLIGFDFRGYVQSFMEGFNFNSGADAIIRRDQFRALIHGWWKQPLFGAGLGAGTPDYVRDPLHVWAYELSYVALLFQTGIIGFLLYSAGIIWIFFMGIRMAASQHPMADQMLAMLVGLACFLVANATNPYLGKYDLMWVIFLPVAMINHYMLYADYSLRRRSQASRP